MPISDKKIISDLENLFLESQNLIKLNNLHLRKKRILKPGEPGFNQTNSLNEYALQNWFFPGHNDWWDKLEDIFSKHKLNQIRFDMRIKNYDNTESTPTISSRFISAVEELENIVSDRSPLRLYRSLPIKELAVTYSEGRVAYGEESHVFQEKNAKLLIDYFWNKRLQEKTGIQNSDHKISPETAMKDLAISLDALKAAMEAVNVSMRRKAIPLRLKSKYGMKEIYLYIGAEKTN